MFHLFSTKKLPNQKRFYRRNRYHSSDMNSYFSEDQLESRPILERNKLSTKNNPGNKISFRKRTLVNLTKSCIIIFIFLQVICFKKFSTLTTTTTTINSNFERRNQLDKRSKRRYLTVEGSSSSSHKEHLIMDGLFSSNSFDEKVLDVILPKESHLRSLYGIKPVILSSRTVQGQRFLSENSIGNQPKVKPIGLPGTGSGLLSKLLENNCLNIKKEVYIVIIQDPIQWMYSICQLRFRKGFTKIKFNQAPDRCPNILVNSYDVGFYPHGTVDVQFFNNGTEVETFNSLIDLWNNYYKKWLQNDIGRIIIRFEDLLYHPKLIVKEVCSYLDGSTSNSFTHLFTNVDSLLTNENLDISDKNILSALMRFGNQNERNQVIQDEKELQYVQKVVDKNLLTTFKYINFDEIYNHLRQPLGLQRSY